MKGKKLHSLVRSMSKPERHQMLNFCKRSGDKRHKALYEFLKGNYAEKNQFTQALDRVADFLFMSKGNVKQIDEVERDKNLRRFIDFAVKEIENLKMTNLLKEDQLMRNYLMANIYANSPSTELFLDYTKRTQSEAKKSKDLYFQSKALEMEIQAKYLSQTDKNLDRVSEAASDRIQVVNDLYHKSLSNSFNVLSNCALDDRSAMDDLANFIEEYKIDQIISLGGQRASIIEYKIAEMRMVFEQPDQFRRLNTEAEILLKELDLIPKNRLSFERRLTYLQGLFVFNQGEFLDEYLQIGDKLLNLNIELNYPDSFAFFFYLFGLAVTQNWENIEQLREENGDLFMREETDYMFEFLEAYEVLDKEDISSAIKKLNLLSYAPNYYIASWSRLLEIKAHYLRGNDKFCKNLIQRMVRFEAKNPKRVFSKASNLFILSELAKLIGYPELVKTIKPKKRPMLTFMHQRLEDWIKTEMK